MKKSRNQYLLGGTLFLVGLMIGSIFGGNMGEEDLQGRYSNSIQLERPTTAKRPYTVTNPQAERADIKRPDVSNPRMVEPYRPPTKPVDDSEGWDWIECQNACEVECDEQVGDDDLGAWDDCWNACADKC